MSVPTPERHGRLSRLHKISAATGAAAVGVTAIAFSVVPGQKDSGNDTAGSEPAAQAIALQTAADSPATQKAGIDAQTTAADGRARASAEKAARKKAEARAKARQEAAEQAKKAERERQRKQAASRSAERAASPSGSPKQIARQIIGSEKQFQCFSNIVERESGWDVHAQNPSGAYGLVQALPGSKMASAGPDWRNSAATQIKWGLGYMKDRYGSPCGAWSFWQANNWY
ncbi:Transglycosylase SLT domain-containing protein [Streptomyces sp. WMMB 714]|jgi:ATPase subunit of ABC transporter with duplicated ATPase domains|uniref:aggregation-promoting factor C-terminal-like domain-containing protein n=1 Tax=Streptomyces sp. WMMB 714 TaxID=1286822 RepID=UPI0005F77D5F|nr:transglycosylase SLT domain-containing protein [Streptomyces sp. WMMB 714]SCK30822.1 Transglycosylase SLT domain-containing protein [Streptomyces sp. WMMB 714]